MEIERIQQVQGLRVERTGSESERRRHQRPDEEFDELLEQTPQDGQGKEQQQGNAGSGQQEGDRCDIGASQHPQQVIATLHGGDTVSISSLMPAVPANSIDTVSLSTSVPAGLSTPHAEHPLQPAGAIRPARPPEPGTAEEPPAPAPLASIDTIA